MMKHGIFWRDLDLVPRREAITLGRKNILLSAAFSLSIFDLAKSIPWCNSTMEWILLNQRWKG
jgi:hypothetical protein